MVEESYVRCPHCSVWAQLKTIGWTVLAVVLFIIQGAVAVAPTVDRVRSVIVLTILLIPVLLGCLIFAPVWLTLVVTAFLLVRCVQFVIHK